MYLAYQHASLTLDAFQPFFDAFGQFGAQGVAFSDKYDVDNKPFSVIAIGVMHDPGKWFVTAELARTESSSFLGSKNGWYASGGYRFGKFTPYLMYGEATADNLSDPGLAAPLLRVSMPLSIRS